MIEGPRAKESVGRCGCALADPKLLLIMALRQLLEMSALIGPGLAIRLSSSTKKKERDMRFFQRLRNIFTDPDVAKKQAQKGVRGSGSKV